MAEPGRATALISLLLCGLLPSPWGCATAPAQAAPSPTPSAAAVASEQPQPVGLPASLARRSRMEPSAALWVPELNRFLLVSDDTGTRDAADQAPWVFTMDRSGAIDPEPLVLEGIGSVADLEAVARSGSSIYLLSSQSVSRSGRRSAARELFLRAALGPGRRLRVTGRCHLLQAIAAAARGEGGAAWLESLGLGARAGELAERGPDGTDLVLDLEGLAFWDGALLVGVKSPFAPGGLALLWRLQDPDRLLDGQPLARDALTTVARLPLHWNDGEALVTMGISGLEPRRDGTLLLLSTQPSDEEGPFGAMWSLDLRATPPALRALRAFPGLKPEGGAYTPDGALLLVFDLGYRHPLWLAVPRASGPATPRADRAARAQPSSGGSFGASAALLAL